MHLTNRWDVVFYFFGGVSILYWIVFSYLCYDRPETNPFISEAEKAYLERKINDFDKDHSKLPATPWRSMLCSPPVMALSFSTVRYWNFSFHFNFKIIKLTFRFLCFRLSTVGHFTL